MSDTQDIFKGRHAQRVPASEQEADYSGLDIFVDEGTAPDADGLDTDVMEKFILDSDLMDTAPAAGFTPEQAPQDKTQAFVPAGDPIPQHASQTAAQGTVYYAGKRPSSHYAQEQYPSEQPAQEKRHRKRARHPVLSGFLWIGMLAAAAMCALRMLPTERSSGRVFPEVVAFIPWLMVPIAVVLMLALLWHRRFLAIFSALCLGLVFYWHAGYFVSSNHISDNARTLGRAQASVEDNVVRVMTLNTLNGHADASDIIRAVRDNNIEVLALQEVTSSLLSDLADQGIFELLPHYVFGDPSQWDNGGINVLFSLSSMTNQNTNLLPMDLSSMPAGSIDVGGVTLRFVSIHPGSPHLGGHTIWNTGLNTVGSLSEYDHRYVILGDFNSTWDHSRFRELLGTTFVDASEQAGEGFHMTYPSHGVIPALIEIDHVVYTKDSGVRAGDITTLGISGTDHKALIVTLEVVE